MCLAKPPLWYTLQDIPHQMKQSKLLPAETLFADSCLARLNADPASTSSQAGFACGHSSPCLAPQGGHSQAFWLLAAIDEACSVIPATRSSFRLLDLSRTDTGALEYAMSKRTHQHEADQLVAVDSRPARQLQEQAASVLLWNPWKAGRAVPFSTGGSSWQLQMPEQPLVNLVVGMVSHTEAGAVTGVPAANEHSTAYRNELLWRCLAALTSLAPGMPSNLCL